MKKILLALFFIFGFTTFVWADDDDDDDHHDEEKIERPAVTVIPTGTVRAKFEYQPTPNNARFNVRTARFGIGGELYSNFAYKMEIDLCDEGKIKMVDAYVAAKIYKGLNFSIGFMRVPFTIDAHRSPHLQYFANRSFIAKQVGNVRDIGAVVGWRFGEETPVNLQFGVFNGSGLEEGLSTYWTTHFNYSAKAQISPLHGMNVVASYQTTMPQNVRIHLYDLGCTYRTGRWMMEAEYLRKEYTERAFDGVDAVDAFVCYGLPTKGFFKTISFLGRYDYMSDHSNGVANDNGVLFTNDHKRHRATAGITFSLGLPFTADIRLNYEKYFYDNGTPIDPSGHDKIVVEFMAHF